MAAAQQQHGETVGVGEFFGSLAEAVKVAMQEGVKSVNPRRDNPDYTPDTVFEPRGVVKEEMKRRYFFAGIEQERAQLTPEEVSLYNQLPSGNSSRILTMAGLPREVKLEETQDGSSTMLKVSFPITQEERAYLPSQVKILKAILSGASSVE